MLNEWWKALRKCVFSEWMLRPYSMSDMPRVLGNDRGGLKRLMVWVAIWILLFIFFIHLFNHWTFTELALGYWDETDMIPIFKEFPIFRAGSLSLGTVDILDWMILCCGAVQCIVECLATFLASTFQMPVALSRSPSLDSQKCIQMLPNAPYLGRYIDKQKHSYKAMWMSLRTSFPRKINWNLMKFPCRTQDTKGAFRWGWVLLLGSLLWTSLYF